MSLEKCIFHFHRYITAILFYDNVRRQPNITSFDTPSALSLPHNDENSKKVREKLTYFMAALQSGIEVKSKCLMSIVCYGEIKWKVMIKAKHCFVIIELREKKNMLKIMFFLFLWMKSWNWIELNEMVLMMLCSGFGRDETRWETTRAMVWFEMGNKSAHA